MVPFQGAVGEALRLDPHVFLTVPQEGLGHGFVPWGCRETAPPPLIAELLAAKVDVIVAAGTPAAIAVKMATTTGPLVMVAAGDPVGTGLVPSLARPSGNLTGLSSIAPDLEGKRLELLRE